MFNIQFSIKKIIIILTVLFCFSSVFSQEIKRVTIDDLEKIITETKSPLIVNFFATWCKPCVEELPYFLQEFSVHKKDSLQLLMVSLDFKDFFPQKILSFAKKRKVTAPIVWLDETNADVFCPKIDSTWSGAIPASLFINSATGYKSFYEGQISQEQLKKFFYNELNAPGLY
jgi:thiol-disulfide isomerase/thioredoxin